jgi:sensor domain DACNV-containing protein
MSNIFTINSSISRDIADQNNAAVKRELQRFQDPLVRELLEPLLELDAKKLETVLEACFFASIEREEGRMHNFTVAIAPTKSVLSDSLIARLPPDTFAHSYVFETFLDIDMLARISPAIVATHQQIGVWFCGDHAKIWGFSGMNIHMSAAVQIKTFQPGQLGVFVPLCPTKQLYLISATRAESISGSLSLAELLFNEKDLSKQRSSDHLTRLRYCGRIQRWTRLLMDIANRMRRHGHGGTLLVIPGEDTASILKASIKPLEMALESPVDYIRQKLVREEDEELHAYERNVPNYSLPWSFDNEAQLLAQATAVDGATIITKDFGLIAFGAKIEKASQAVPVQVLMSEPFEDSRRPAPKPLSDLGGTRHQSAAQFVFDQHSAFAIVASQDGRLSVVSWNGTKQIVSVFRHAEYLFIDLS